MLANDRGTEPVGGCLQSRDVVDGEEGIVVFLKADVAALQLLFDERMTVEPIGGVEREKGRDTYDDRPQDLVPDVEVVMGKAACLVRQDAVVGILRRVFRYADPESPALFHALEDEVDAERILFLHAA